MNMVINTLLWTMILFLLTVPTASLFYELHIINSNIYYVMYLSIIIPWVAHLIAVLRCSNEVAEQVTKGIKYNDIIIRYVFQFYMLYVGSVFLYKGENLLTVIVLITPLVISISYTILNHKAKKQNDIKS